MLKLLEKLEECHLEVRFEKHNVFMKRIKYCGHVLHDGVRSPAPSNVDTLRNGLRPKSPKHMKGSLGVENGYSIYIKMFPMLQLS